MGGVLCACVYIFPSIVVTIFVTLEFLSVLVVFVSVVSVFVLVVFVYLVSVFVLVVFVSGAGVSILPGKPAPALTGSNHQLSPVSATSGLLRRSSPVEPMLGCTPFCDQILVAHLFGTGGWLIVLLYRSQWFQGSAS